ncbi:MAG: stage III sporulation protein AD [Clostridia bacterium]|nr:stage III sporulation protein AD [Clostridia bacterium]
MDIFKILAFALVALVLILIVEKNNKEMGVLLILLASIGILVGVFSSIKEVITILKKLADGAGINSKYLSIIIKVTGIAYLVEIVKNVCVDAGNSSLATKVELAGKLSIAILTIPLITNVISLVEGLV